MEVEDTVEPAHVQELIIEAVFMAQDLLLFISLLRQFYCVEQQFIHKYFKYSTIITFIFSTMYYTTGIVHNLVSGEYIFSTILILSLVMMIYSIYTILLQRLYYTFEESVYEIKTRQLSIHIINIVITLSLFVASTFIDVVAEAYNITIYKHTNKVLLVIWVLLLIMGYIHLLYTFNHNLFLLVLSQRQTIFCKQSAKTVKLSMRQIIMLSTIRKHTILGCFMIISNLGFLICTSAGIPIKETTSDISLVFQKLTLNIFIISGPLAIYMGFTQNEDLYGFCCKLCDKTCKNICRRLAEHKLNE